MLFPSFMDQSFTNGPNVVVEPSYETEKELHMAFTEQDFGRVSNLLLQFFTDSPTCPILDSLLFLIKTHSLGDPILPDQLLTVGDIVIQIIVCACKSGNMLSNFIVCYFHSLKPVFFFYGNFFLFPWFKALSIHLRT